MKKHYIILAVILLLAFAVRLYKFSSPIADWHSWRQADTSSVSRIFIQEGFDLLHPKFDDLSNVPSGKDNPEGYRFVEFPIYNVLQAGGFSLLPVMSLEEWGRFITIIASVLSVLLLYLIVARHAEENVALASAFFLAFLPYNIYYGRVILPDPLMVTTTLGAIYFFDRWILQQDKKQLPLFSKWFGLALICATSALLLKPFAAFFFLPIGAILYASYGLTFFKRWQLYMFALFSVLPLIFWRLWMLQYPEGIPASDWLFNGGNIRFKGAYFYWVFADHIGREMLGFAGYALVFLGILVISGGVFLKHQKDKLLFFSFVLATVAYLFVVARGNVQHDYYQIPIVPTIALLMGFGTATLLRPFSQFGRFGSILVLVVSTCFTFFFGWYVVRDLFNINNPNIVAAGQAVDRLTPKDAKVITFYDGDTSFLYQTNRKGWASLEKSLPEMIAMGATHLAIVNPTEKDQKGLGTEYQVVASDPRYLILKLK